jgi:hypothetical protein
MASILNRFWNFWCTQTTCVPREWQKLYVKKFWGQKQNESQNDNYIDFVDVTPDNKIIGKSQHNKSLVSETLRDIMLHIQS